VVLHLRERRRCQQLACRMAGRRATLALLAVAALVVASSIALDRFPELSSELIAKLTEGREPTGHSQHQINQTRPQ
jgi:hypothetical protein